MLQLFSDVNRRYETARVAKVFLHSISHPGFFEMSHLFRVKGLERDDEISSLMWRLYQEFLHSPLPYSSGSSKVDENLVGIDKLLELRRDINEKTRNQIVEFVKLGRKLLESFNEKNRQIISIAETGGQGDNFLYLLNFPFENSRGGEYRVPCWQRVGHNELLDLGCNKSVYVLRPRKRCHFACDVVVIPCGPGLIGESRLFPWLYSGLASEVHFVYYDGIEKSAEPTGAGYIFQRRVEAAVTRQVISVSWCSGYGLPDFRVDDLQESVRLADQMAEGDAQLDTETNTDKSDQFTLGYRLNFANGSFAYVGEAVEVVRHDDRRVCRVEISQIQEGDFYIVGQHDRNALALSRNESAEWPEVLSKLLRSGYAKILIEKIQKVTGEMVAIQSIEEWSDRKRRGPKSKEVFGVVIRFLAEKSSQVGSLYDGISVEDIIDHEWSAIVACRARNIQLGHRASVALHDALNRILQNQNPEEDGEIIRYHEDGLGDIALYKIVRVSRLIPVCKELIGKISTINGSYFTRISF
jgi:hypothetical protein